MQLADYGYSRRANFCVFVVHRHSIFFNLLDRWHERLWLKSSDLSTPLRGVPPIK